jgi:hypothetical protein
MAQVRKTRHHSVIPSRVHLARPVGEASNQVVAVVPMVVLARRVQLKPAVRYR